METSTTALTTKHETSWTADEPQRNAKNAYLCATPLDYMHLNPVRKGLVKRPEQWPWSSYNNYALDKEQIKRCPVQIDHVHWPESYRG